MEVGGLTRAVLLDALGTLLELQPPGPGLRRALGARGIEVPPATAERAMAAEIAYYRAHMMTGGTRRGLRALRGRCARVLAGELGQDIDEAVSVEDLEAALLETLRFAPFADVPRTLAALRAEGARVIVASNWDCSLHDVLAATGLASLVDGAVTSAEVGRPKPDPELFARALSMAGVPARAAVHVGDRLEEDVAGARAAGIEPVLVVRDGPALPEAAGVRVIHSLDELIPAAS